ncbi:g923 [Coccomyxa elongata]
MSPHQRLLIEGSTEAGLGVLLFALMIPFGYTTLPLLAAGALEAVGIRDIIQALRMQIAATKNETRVPTPPVANGLDF